MYKESEVAVKRDPAKWEAAKREAKAKMGGKHSARAMQLATQIYKKKGGTYAGKKPSPSSNKLKKWTKQDWQWSGGDKKGQGGSGVYLPKRATSALKSTDQGKAKLRAAIRNKSKATREGRQFSSHGLHVGKNRSEVKTAGFTQKDKRRYKRIAAYGLGAGVLAGTALTLRHKGVRAHIRAKVKAMRGGAKAQSAAAMNMSSTEVPQFARNHINDVMGVLKKQGYSADQLANMKIGIVGTGGTGKSSLALALQEQAPNLQHLNLDSHISRSFGSLGTADIAGALKQKGGIKPGTISDQVQLLHGADPGKFDLIIKVKRDPSDIVEGLYNRGHYGFVADYSDMKKAQTLVDDAFNMSGGKRFKVNNNIEISLNPSTAGSSVERRQAARRLGFDMKKFNKLSQRDQLISISEGMMSKGQSWRSRISSGKLERDMAGAGVATIGGGYYASRD